MKSSDYWKFIDFSKYKSILCLDGVLPKAEFFKNINLPIIAADGAANVLFDRGITPNVIIGDLDSVRKDLLQIIPYVKSLDQDYSDFQKALGYVASESLCPSIICGVNGGCLDHIINNINIFLETKSALVDDGVVGLCLEGNNVFKLSENTKLSIFGMPECIISSQGLKWNLANSKLTFPGNASLSNRASLEDVVIDVKQGKALLLIYTEKVTDAGIEGASLTL
ncbi:MAG: thiamine diphosphokinase [Holosporales bacterium]|jgi:thiamine pyrophosphokinase|nr:thiamine diphosphokinase [Holosporales bacterium]